MLQKCIDLNHPVKELQVSVLNYLNTIKYLPVGIVFDTAHCDAKFAGFIGIRRKTIKPNTRSLIESFQNAFLGLSQQDRDQFIFIFNQTNNLKVQFANPTTAVKLGSYNASLQNETHALFLNLYEKVLPKYNVKDHYKKVFMAKKDTWCPFCGMERFISFKRFKQDYDHLLLKAEYPVSAVNMYNLAPMGINCNRIHKKTKDLLSDDTGTARSAVNPYYNVIKPRVNLNGSIMSSDPKKRIWKINIIPNSSEVMTWDSVFNISVRCKEDFLDKISKSKQVPEVDTLIYTFVQSSKFRIAQYKKNNVPTVWNLKLLKMELEIKRNEYNVNYYHEYNYIKYAVFDFLLKDECKIYRNVLLKTIIN